MKQIFTKSFSPTTDNPDLEILLSGLSKSGKKTLLKRLDYFANLTLTTLIANKRLGGRADKKPWLDDQPRNILEKIADLANAGGEVIQYSLPQIMDLDVLGGADKNRQKINLDNENDIRNLTLKFNHDTRYLKSVKILRKEHKMHMTHQTNKSSISSVSPEKSTQSPSNSETGLIFNQAHNLTEPCNSPKNSKSSIKKRRLTSTKLNINFQLNKNLFSNFHGIIYTIDLSDHDKIDESFEKLLEFIKSTSLEQKLENDQNDQNIAIEPKMLQIPEKFKNLNLQEKSSKFEPPIRVTSAASFHPPFSNQHPSKPPLDTSGSLSPTFHSYKLPILLIGTFSDQEGAAHARDLYTYLKIEQLNQKFGDTIVIKVFATSNLFGKVDKGLNCGIGWIVEEILRGRHS